MRIRATTVMVTSLVLAIAGLLPGPVRAQTGTAQPAVQDSSPKPIGKIVTATGSVTIEHVDAVVVQANVAGQANQTKVGDVVYLGDVVQTGADGRVGINFADGTSFNLSTNARMALTEYVYDPNGKSNSTFFNLSKGTFTFVAGNIAKTGDMKIDTPVATMGVRGTTPHVEITDDGKVAFSTLVEDKKAIEKLTATDENKPAPTVKQRQAKSEVPPGTPSTPAAEKKPVYWPAMKFDTAYLKICRGC